MAALSIQEPSLPNVLIMCQTCKEVAPGAFIMTDGSGQTLFHLLLCWNPPSPQVLSIAKFLIDQEICRPLLLQKAEMFRGEMTPLELVQYQEGSVKSSIDMDVRLKRPASDAKTASLHIYTQLKQSIELATTEQQV
jgi:hypothetical protein